MRQRKRSSTWATVAEPRRETLEAPHTIRPRRRRHSLSLIILIMAGLGSGCTTAPNVVVRRRGATVGVRDAPDLFI